MICEVSVGLDFKTGFRERDPGGKNIVNIASTCMNMGRWLQMSLFTKEVCTDR